MKTITIFGILLCTACASTQAPREPANISADAAAAEPMKYMFSNTAVAQAYLLGAPDARGRRQPLCRYDVAKHPELVPTFTTPAAEESKQTFGLKTCSVTQLDRVAEVAALGSRAVVAGPGKLAVICAIDLGLGFTLQAALNKTNNESGKAADERRVDALNAPAAHFVPGAIETLGAAGVGVGRGSKSLTRSIGGPMLLTAVCTGVGAAVGYLLVPLR